jgi:hypothetical protein
MRYIPSPIPIQFQFMYTATANKSGRMQYHKVKPGESKLRISRNEFIRAFNSIPIVSLRPIQMPGNESDFQLEFFV